MKYIIKNCPALNMLDITLNSKVIETVSNCFEAHCKCEDRADCLLKQIVELCKKCKKDWEEIKDVYNYTDEYKNFKSGREDLGRQIIDFLLDIQEVEE